MWGNLSSIYILTIIFGYTIYLYATAKVKRYHLNKPKKNWQAIMKK
jgi:hypothetical protein